MDGNLMYWNLKIPGRYSPSLQPIKSNPRDDVDYQAHQTEQDFWKCSTFRTLAN